MKSQLTDFYFTKVLSIFKKSFCGFSLRHDNQDDRNKKNTKFGQNAKCNSPCMFIISLIKRHRIYVTFYIILAAIKIITKKSPKSVQSMQLVCLFIIQFLGLSVKKEIRQ